MGYEKAVLIAGYTLLGQANKISESYGESGLI
jgi:hypothetical protein